MPRGRPRKVVIVQTEEVRTIQGIMADVMHRYCSIPGCRVSLHFEEASEVIDTLKENGFTIQEID
jgi:hypothetical protein